MILYKSFFFYIFFNLYFNFKIIIYYYFYNYLVLFIRFDYRINFFIRLLLVNNLNKKLNSIFIEFIPLKLKFWTKAELKLRVSIELAIFKFNKTK